MAPRKEGRHGAPVYRNLRFSLSTCDMSRWCFPHARKRSWRFAWLRKENTSCPVYALHVQVLRNTASTGRESAINTYMLYTCKAREYHKHRNKEGVRSTAFLFLPKPSMPEELSKCTLCLWTISSGSGWGILGRFIKGLLSEKQVLNPFSSCFHGPRLY